MRHSRYEQLCDDLCDLLGVERKISIVRPDIQERRFTLHGLDIRLLYQPLIGPPTAALVIHLGTIVEDEYRGWIELLQVNHSMRGSLAPRFARDPQTGSVLLHCTFQLTGMCADELFFHATAAIKLASDWSRKLTRSFQ